MNDRPKLASKFGLPAHVIAGAVGFAMGLVQRYRAPTIPTSAQLGLHSVMGLLAELNRPPGLAVIAALIAIGLLSERIRGWRALLFSWILGGMLGSMAQQLF